MKTLTILSLAVLVMSTLGVFSIQDYAFADNVSWGQDQATMDEYIKQDMKLKGGKFLILDEKTGKVLALNFEGLHEKVKLIEEEHAYYACADFRSTDGKTLYDVDFWLKEDAQDMLYVDRVMIHKENGKARFSYDNYTLIPIGKKGKIAPEYSSL